MLGILGILPQPLTRSPTTGTTPGPPADLTLQTPGPMSPRVTHHRHRGLRGPIPLLLEPGCRSLRTTCLCPQHTGGLGSMPLLTCTPQLSTTRAILPLATILDLTVTTLGLDVMRNWIPGGWKLSSAFFVCLSGLPSYIIWHLLSLPYISLNSGFLVDICSNYASRIVERISA
jgi:hypothetical protein